MATPWNNPSRPTATPMTGRAGVIAGNSISPIITGYWNDLNTWLETGKLWNDNGDNGTAWAGRTLI